MRKVVFLIVALFSISGVVAQFGLSAGPSVIKTFASPKALMGFHVGGELSQDDESSYFGRISFAPGAKEEAVNYANLEAIPGLPTTPPYAVTTFTTKTNFTTIEGGVRYYLGDGYETGFAAYGGTKIVLGFNKVKAKFGDFNQQLYQLQDGFDRFGTVFGFGFGLQGGVKYGITGIGTVYFDMGFNYMLSRNASNAMVNYSSYLNQPLFAFNLGFRKDLYFGK